MTAALPVRPGPEPIHGAGLRHRHALVRSATARPSPSATSRRACGFEREEIRGPGAGPDHRRRLARPDGPGQRRPTAARSSRRMRRTSSKSSAYPEITYQADDVSVRADRPGPVPRSASAAGSTLHGVTRPAPRSTRRSRSSSDGIRLRGDDPLRLSDYRIKPVTALGGAIKLKDELKLSFDLVGLTGGAMNAAPRSSSPASATSSWATTPSASRSLAGWRPVELPEGVARGRLRHPGDRPDLCPARTATRRSSWSTPPRGAGRPARSTSWSRPSDESTGPEAPAPCSTPTAWTRRRSSGWPPRSGGRVGRLLLVGCEPEPLAEPDDMQDGLSGPVRAAVDEAVPLILSLAGRLLRGEEPSAGGDVDEPREGGRTHVAL